MLHFISLRSLYLCPGNPHFNAGVRMHKLLSSDSDCWRMPFFMIFPDREEWFSMISSYKWYNSTISGCSTSLPSPIKFLHLKCHVNNTGIFFLLLSTWLYKEGSKVQKAKLKTPLQSLSRSVLGLEKEMRGSDMTTFQQLKNERYALRSKKAQRLLTFFSTVC